MSCTAWILNRGIGAVRSPGSLLKGGGLLFFFALCLCAQELPVGFVGNERYSADELSDIVEEECGDYQSKQDLSYIDDAAYKILCHYRENGYNFARVRCVLSVSLRGGMIIPFNDTESIPIQKRFFSGGATTVRSFKEKEMPPLDASDNPLGGEGLFLASLELRIPIYDNFGISVFADTGEIIPVVREIEDYRLSKLKYAVGFSVWYGTVVGPIRFDMGFNPDRELSSTTGKKEELFAWFISIGFSY